MSPSTIRNPSFVIRNYLPVLLLWFAGLAGGPLVAQSGGGANVPSGQGVAGNGLWGEYFNGPDFNVRVTGRLDPYIHFDWARHRPEGVNAEYFTIRWTGKLFVPETGTYTFVATVDDGIRLWLNGRQLMNEWRRQVAQTYSAEVELEGNKYYDLRIEYYNDWLQGHFELAWKAPENATGVLGFFGYAPAQPIPRKYLLGRKPATVPAPARPPVRPAVAVGPEAKPKAPPTGKPERQTDLRVVTQTDRNPVTRKATEPAAGNTAEKPLPRLEAGRAVVLKEVFFAQGEYTLLPASYPELDGLAAALRENPSVRIEIHGHTDNVGDARLNLALSENRALVVANYLMRKGIAEDRIAHRGFGGSRPVKGNATEAEREQNRRVEFVVHEE